MSADRFQFLPLQDLIDLARATWQLSCEHEGIDPETATFAVFTDGNKWVRFFNRCMNEIQRRRAAGKM